MSAIRVMLAGILLVVVAVPTLFVFESMVAVNSVFLNRQTWYDVMATPAVYDAAVEQFSAKLTGSQRETLRAALPPAYVQSQLNRLVDYSFEILNGVNAPSPTFDVPAALADVLRDDPALSFLRVVETENGGLRLSVDVSERSLAQVRGLATQYTIAMVISAVFGMVFLVAVALLAADTTRTRLMWLGGGLMLPSFLVIIVGVAFNSTFMPLLTQRLTYDSRELEAASLAVMDGLAGTLPRLGTALTVAGGIPLAIGLILLVAGSVMRPRQPDGIRQGRYPLA